MDHDSGDPNESTVVIRTFLNQTEADIAHGALTAFGIESFLSHDDCGGQRAHLNLVGGIRLMVNAEDVAQAEEALTAEAESESDDD